MHIFPALYKVYNVLVPNLLNIPRSDFGFGIPSRLRALLIYQVSKSYGCPYCVAHCATVGSVPSGPNLYLADMPHTDNLDSDRWSPADRAALRFAAAVATSPSRNITPEILADLRHHFSPHQVHLVFLAPALMGFLNSVMNTLGPPLEPISLLQAQQHLESTGWGPGKHRIADEELAATKTQLSERRTKLQRAAGLAQLAKDVVGTVRAEAEWLKDVPVSMATLAKYMEERWGFWPSYIGELSSPQAARAICYGLLEMFECDGDAVHARLKHSVAYAMACSAENARLAVHFGYTAVRHGAALETLRAAAVGEEVGAPGSVEDLAFRFARVYGTPRASEKSMAEELADGGLSPSDVVNLVGVVGVFGLLNRLSCCMGRPDAAWEDGVAEFAESEAGRLLRLPA